MKRYIRPRAIPGKTGISIAIAVVLMVTVSYVNWNYFQKPDYRSTAEPVMAVEEVQPVEKTEPAEEEELFGPEFEDLTKEIRDMLPAPEPAVIIPEPAEKKTEEIVKPEKETRVSPVINGEPVKIAIIIDDMGVDANRTRQIINLNPPLTLAFLPYAPAVSSLAQEAADRGHELMIHMPMEPMNPDLDTGPIAIRSRMSEQEIDDMLTRAFASFEGYTGVNNHMGSKVTQDNQIMSQVMKRLGERNLYFVDSKTIHTSVAGTQASLNSIDYAERDVFLDHVDTVEGVRESIAKLERTAARTGKAIAIGHPRDVTIQVLKEWLPTTRSKNIEIVTVNQLLKRKHEQQDPDLAAINSLDFYYGDLLMPVIEPTLFD